MHLPIIEPTSSQSNIRGAVQDREALVINKIREFQCAELIITDRLHGMVFAALAGTPCIAFNNTDHKVQGVYEWLSSLPYITFVENPSGVSSDIAAALGHHSKTYDHDAMLPYYHNLEMALSQQV
ncbi:polysaccharide pyruvyl transferase family protein [Bifidobacterium tibiigranuli]|uniref:polysaccharide pyruvyl transferase family protein n=1 Tax=Bifidobacterium tibiigranuli TaxID=2172043 RepID=UPI0026EED318|nr:polysaccharide pyruvyl transferase family protein [Bifidobacterium tibiigranuli]